LVLPARRGAITIGAHSRNDIVLPDFASAHRYPLVTRTGRREAHLRLRPDMRGEVYVNGHKYTVAEAVDLQGAEGLKIGRLTRARLVFGDSTILVHQSTQPTMKLPHQGVDRRLTGFVSMSIVLHALLVALALLVPPQLSALVVGEDLPDGLVTLNVDLIDREPEPVTVMLINEPQAGEPAPDEAGEVGRPDGTEREGRMAVRGIEDNGRETPRQSAPSVAAERGVVDVIAQLGGARNLFTRPTGGAEPFTFSGTPGAPTFADRRGSLGLSPYGSGPGGGGRPGAGDIFGMRGGCDTIETCDHGMWGSGTRGLRPSLGINLPERPSVAPPEVIPCCAEQGATADRDSIRRVIRTHAREIRACYERELQHDPELNGRIVLHLVLFDGNVTLSEVNESTLDNERVHECIARRARSWRFPRPDTPGIVNVNYPYVFTSD